MPRAPWRARTTATAGAPTAALAVALAGLLLVAVPVSAGLPGGPAPGRQAPATAAWTPLTPPLDTPWTQDVSTTDPLPEYPRPQMVRREWQSLNGLWDYVGAGIGDTSGAGPGGVPALPTGPPQRVLVPYPVTSALSGIARQDQVMRYSRSFTVPASWSGRRTVLNFGGVTWQTTVTVNGTRVGTHRGSYDAFSVDVTDALRPGANDLVVDVVDPGSAGGQPIGKQFYRSMLVEFTPAPGIWQSVWMEPVAPTHLLALDNQTDLPGQRLLFTPEVTGARPGTRVRVTVTDAGRPVGTATGTAGAVLAVPVARPHLWSPDDPHLYDVRAQVLQDDRTVDALTSYAGMREVRLGTVDGVPRPLLNGRFLFQMGTLDQGYWPDGVYTAPTDEALRFDIEETKRLGFNTIRKHMKVEPQRWYTWADRLGVLVWQDMPSMTVYRPVSTADQAQFESELHEVVQEHRSHPSIVQWVPWNEGWGQYDVRDRVDVVVRQVKAQDPTRLVDGHSGSANCCTAIDPPSSDVHDSHLYDGPWAPRPTPGRASVIGEMGGLSGRTPGHEWHPEKASDPTGPTGTTTPQTPRERLGLLTRQWQALAQQARDPGLSAAVFTEITDVERELSGFLTYDRRVHKVDPAALRALNRRLIADASEPAGPTPTPTGVPAGTRALWSFDEGAGATAAARGPAAAPLTLATGAGWTAGVHGSALVLDGRGGQAATRLPVLDTRRSYTVAAWLRHDDALQSAPAVSQDGVATSAFSLGQMTSDSRPDLVPAYAFRPPPGSYPHTRWSLDVSGRPTACPSECLVRANTGYDDGLSAPRAGQWQYVVGVVDRATLTTSLYVDGVPQDVRVLDRPSGSVGPFRVGAGRGVYAGDRSFTGAVDEVRVYDRALTPAEVRALALASGAR